MSPITRLVLALRQRRDFLCGLLVLGLSGMLAQNSVAGLLSLADDNSAADFNTDSQANAYSWTVDGVDQLFQQAFWYRIGNAPQSSLDTLPHPTEGTTDTNFDNDDDTLFVRYDGGALGSGASDMGEQISITNLGASPLDFHFFQYSDFDLAGSAGGDEALFTNANTVRQYEGAMELQETVVTPVPSHREINYYANVLTALNGGAATTLSDLPAIGTVFGPGDITWAYQWDVLVQPGSTFQISKDKNLKGVVPEPSSLALLTVAVGLLFGLRRKR
jgi:PEP-CTERM motif